jgi:hypothetical protein
MMNFTRMAGDIDVPRKLEAIFRFDKKNRRRGLFIAKFCGMFGKGSDGAP